MIRRVPLGAALFFALLTITLVVAVLVVRARSPDLVLEVTTGLRLPAQIERGETLSFSFFVREDEPGAEVAIVDSEEEIVAVLDEEVSLDAEQEVTYEWDGRDETGEPVPPGRYRVQVEAPASDRTMIWPKRITVGHPQPLLPPETGGE